MNVLHLIPAFKQANKQQPPFAMLIQFCITSLLTMIKQLTFKVHLILHCSSYNCKFAYFLKCIFGPKSTLMAFLQSFADMSTVTKKSESPNNSQLSLNKVTLCCWVPAHILLMIYTVPSLLYLGAGYCFSLKMVPKCRAEVLPNVPRFKKVVMCLTEKIHVRHNLCDHELQHFWSWVHHPKWMNSIY